MDEAVELAELRRRAYGPEGGIDAVGLARLRELEERAHERARPAPVVEPEPAPVEPPIAPMTAPGQEPEADAPEQDASTPRSSSVAAWLRRRSVWQVAAAGVLGGAAVVVGGSAIVAAANAQSPVATLRMTDDQRDDRYFGVRDLQPHEMFHGFDVRSKHEHGVACLYVAFLDESDESWFGDMDCAPAADIARISVWVGSTSIDSWRVINRQVDGIAPRTYVRFELRGDDVEVWTTRLPEPSGSSGA
ncbi:hypothetical protein [Microbacterium rhizophilus]|uniref:hypothetical protein n=1 Tax=Microbacterium rhizophilus TaxID=3138934 RepID=UPI0031E69667